LNKEFLSDPIKFLGDYCIMVSDGLRGGPGRFDLKLFNKKTRACQLVNFASRTPEATDLESFGSHPINAYYAGARANNDNVQTLPNNVDFMFTMHMSGCQFLAYGPDRHHVTVEHNNYLDGVSGNYAVHFDQLVLRHPSPLGFLFSVRPRIDYAGEAYVLGVRRGTGWWFYHRVPSATVTGPR